MPTHRLESKAAALVPPKKRRARVMIVEDSRVIRELLAGAIAQDARLEVAAIVDSGEAALDALHRVKPDVISMDVRLPGIDGLDTTRRIMTERATPIVVVASDIEQSDLRISISALQAGALAVLEKPRGAVEELRYFRDRLCTQLAIMSQVRVVTRRDWGRTTAAPRPVLRSRRGAAEQCVCEMVGIVASTGGPSAVVELLGGLGKGFPAPVLVVQHMMPAFLSAFIDWLNDCCPQPVLEARAGVTPEPGSVYVAPVERHLQMCKGRLTLSHDPPVSLQRPSGTVLLSSLAGELGERAAGVVLTGMGDDGASGLLELRAAGGFTIAEAESTAVVYGMPGEAAALGAACEVLPLPQIAPRLLTLAGA